MHPIDLRPSERADLSGIEAVLDATGLFGSELLGGMFASREGGASEDRWLTAAAGDEPVGFAYYVPERMTEGTWNLLAIAVHPDRQGEGIGAALLARIEGELRDRAQRLLLVETSGLPEFARTRAFYAHNGYDEEARVREFYAAGDDKIVFRKALG